MGDLPRCVQFLKANCMASMGAAASPVPASEISKCGTFLETASCEKAQYGTSSCDIRGTRAVGESCASGFQCTTGVCDGSATCGTCVVGLAQGATCTSSSSCAHGLACTNHGANPSTCEPNNYGQTPAGGSCADASTCVAGSCCSFGTWCDGSVCRADLAAGAACTPSPDHCDYANVGLQCSASTSTCVPITMVDAGASCSADVECKASQCVITSGTTGTCTAAPWIGQPCTSEGRCSSGLACLVDNTCGFTPTATCP